MRDPPRFETPVQKDNNRFRLGTKKTRRATNTPRRPNRCDIRLGRHMLHPRSGSGQFRPKAEKSFIAYV